MTRELIYDRGLQSVSMAQIAEAAEVGMGTIYNYFETKEELVNELFDAIAERLSNSVLEEFDGALPPLERLGQLAAALLEFGLEKPRDLLIYEQLNHSPYIRREVQFRDHGVKAAFFAAAMDAQNQGAAKELPAVLLGNVLISYVASILRSHLRNGIEITPALRDGVMDAWIDMIRQTGRRETE